MRFQLIVLLSAGRGDIVLWVRSCCRNRILPYSSR